MSHSSSVYCPCHHALSCLQPSKWDGFCSRHFMPSIQNPFLNLSLIGSPTLLGCLIGHKHILLILCHGRFFLFLQGHLLALWAQKERSILCCSQFTEHLHEIVPGPTEHIGDISSLLPFMLSYLFSGGMVHGKSPAPALMSPRL